MKGIVKFFKKTYGFISPEDKSKDVFVHFTAIKDEGFKTLEEGDRVEFSIVEGEKGPQAEKVRKV